MAKKSLGYVELEWRCPNCDTKNPGFQKTCQSCGMPQPDNVEFVQPGQEKLITDKAKIEEIKAGPDIHCYYCGARNPADAKTCSQCGADLSEGARRKAGQILGAHQSGPAPQIECPACGTPNEANAPKCVQCGASLVVPSKPAQPATQLAPAKATGKWPLIAGIAAVLLLCGCLAAFFIMSSQTEDMTGTVSNVTWSRSIEIEGLVPVTREAWRDEVPAGMVVGVCTQRVRGVQDEPAANAREVCGTPYTVDTGTGAGEVVQDCQYEILEDFCEYTDHEWRVIDTEELEGNDFSPRWPALSLTGDQREGERAETYKITFDTENGQYTFTTRDPALFTQTQVGSRWILEVNSFNAVTNIRPLN